MLQRRKCLCTRKQVPPNSRYYFVFQVMMWLSAVLLLVIQFQPFGFASFSPHIEVNPLWSWSCNDFKCARVDNTSSEGIGQLYDSLELCRLLCGQYSTLWPKPKEIKGLSRKAIPFSVDKVQFNLEGVVGGQNPRNFLTKVTRLFVDNLKKECPGRSLDYGSLVVNVFLRTSSADLNLGLKTNESYSLDIVRTADGADITIEGGSAFGVRHGLETLSQLVACKVIENDDKVLLMMSQAKISDEPAYPHRGLLLDTSRNYLEVKNILRTLDAMSSVKLNVLHWHATDSHSFPLVSISVPQLARHGAYSKDEVYTPEDVANIVDSAKLRGIRILLEIDTPAHAGYGWQWGEKENLGKLALCVNQQPWNKFCVQPPCGQLNPVNENLYEVLKALYGDIQMMFPQLDMFHMGGDEVHIPCWNASSEVIEWMDNKGFTRSTADFLFLWSEFHRKALDAWDQIAGSSNTPIVLWSSHLTEADVIDKYLDSKRYIIETWVEEKDSLPWALLAKGYRLILATKDAWYLDHGFWGNTNYHNWKTVYDNRLPNNKGVLGGEGAMWGELVDGFSLDGRVWPRAAALAERLWSDPGTTSSAAEYRLLEHRERLTRRGIASSTIAPRWCYQNEGLC